MASSKNTSRQAHTQVRNPTIDSSHNTHEARYFWCPSVENARCLLECLLTGVRLASMVSRRFHAVQGHMDACWGKGRLGWRVLSILTPLGARPS